jgi:hypothetical protein
MSETSGGLTGELFALGAALAGRALDAEGRRRIEEMVEENELTAPGSAPSWLLDLLAAIRERRPSDGEVPFKLRGLDDSNTLDLLRELKNVLPMEFVDREESWVLRFPAIAMEAVVFFEGTVYEVHRL